MRAAPGRGRELTLEPETPEGIAIYREWLTQGKLALFSADLREKLRGFLRSGDLVNLVEAAAIIGNFHDKDCEARMLIKIGYEHEVIRLALADDSWRDLGERRKAVSKLLRQKGVRLPRGKRTDPRLVKLVETLTPVLLYAGMRLSSGSASRLVNVLTMIADETGVRGDPRDELRRLLRQRRRQLNFARLVVFEAIANGLRPAPLVNKVNRKPE